MAQQAPAAGGPRRERGGRQAGPDQAHGPATAWSYTGPARPGLEPDWSTAAPEWGTDPGWDASPEWGTDPGWSGPPAGQAPGHGGDQGSQVVAVQRVGHREEDDRHHDTAQHA